MSVIVSFHWSAKTQCIRDVLSRWKVDGLDIPDALGTLYYCTSKRSLLGRLAIVFLYP
jgi:hypothetical protein